MRNGALALVALFIVVQGPDGAGRSAIGWLGDLSAAEVTGLVTLLIIFGLLAGEGWLLLQIVAQNGRLLVRVEALEAQLGIRPTDGSAAPAGVQTEGLPVGAAAPAFALPDLDGATVTLDALRRARQPVLLIFTDPDCGPCTVLLPEIATWQRIHADRLTTAVISTGTAEANRAKASSAGLHRVLLQNDFEIGRAYRVAGTPSAVLVNVDGSVGSPVAGGAAAIRALVAPSPAPRRTVPLAGRPDGAARNGAHATASLVGQAAPALRLPALAGGEIDLADFRGHSTALLFWNPACGFCQQMLEPLKRREAAPPEGAPQLLIVSTDDVAANQALGLRSPVALDGAFATGRAFGANGTPSAVLIDADGTIGSPVAVGAGAVFGLIGLSHTDRATAR
jgi:methylamine dehydrogenase accessory protein MauD